MNIKCLLDIAYIFIQLKTQCVNSYEFCAYNMNKYIIHRFKNEYNLVTFYSSSTLFNFFNDLKRMLFQIWEKIDKSNWRITTSLIFESINTKLILHKVIVLTKL